MQSINISLPAPLKKFVDAQIAQGRYRSVSDYVREVTRANRLAIRHDALSKITAEKSCADANDP